MNDKIPAALASIKRYAPNWVDCDLEECADGNVCIWEDVIAALPPPADGAVTDEMVERADDALSNFCREVNGSMMVKANRLAAVRAALVAAYAAPPADSAMVEALFDSLDEILNYTGGADNALEDEYVVERARAMLAGRK